ncbi:MAG: 30S ribosomal protein S1 [Ruminococcaceae bacterium]|nr:30S ribosomal protein S1 [Oscillospiraceae bacterium]
MNQKYLPEGLLYGSAQNAQYISSLQGLEKAMRDDKIIEAPAVMCDSDMNLFVDLGEIRGIIPRNEVMLCREGEETKTIAIITRVGKPVCFKVTSIGEKSGETVAYLSRRAAQIECKREFLSDLICGDIIQAKITHFENFGAFVDIGCGISSLLSINYISISRIPHPSDAFDVGEYIPVIVKEIDEANDRISVTHRELLGTWEENAAFFAPAQIVSGIVRSIESYGIFIELAPNLAGLAEHRAGVKVGDIASVYIKNIIPEKMKVKLAIVDSAPGILPKKRKYFIDTDEITHIDRWRYSPSSAPRVEETVF